MLVNNLMEKIGFTAGEQSKYYEYKKLAGNKMCEYAKDFMHEKISFNQALGEVHKLQSGKLHQYTIDLLFILECTSFLLEKYESCGISKDIFFDTMRDIKYKLDECARVKNIFGTFVIEWYEGFFLFKRIALGRLQYDILTHSKDSITINDYTVNKGDFLLGCHIPSAGPLKPELCMESFKLAYDFFRDKLDNGILPITCSSWLLYPPYKEVFGENSNISRFADNFKIVCLHPEKDFNAMWRVFGVDFKDCDINSLPAETSMQRNFIQYMKNGNDFGKATGYILFDGKRVLTKAAAE